MNSNEIEKALLYDFNKILTGHIPVYRDGKIVFEKATGTLKGCITTEQEAMPCVYVYISMYNQKGQVVYSYFSESRSRFCAVIQEAREKQLFELDSMHNQEKIIKKIIDFGVDLDEDDDFDGLVYKDYCNFGSPENILDSIKVISGVN